MKLYYSPGSPFARVVRIVALEVAAPCDLVEEETFPPPLVAGVNPAMQVPTLVDGERTVFGTRLIAEYLMDGRTPVETAGGFPFSTEVQRPEHRWRDAQVLVALEAMLSALVTRSYLIWTGAEHRPDAAIPMKLGERELERASRLLDWLETEAAPEGFLPGTFSLHDIWLISIIGWTEARIQIAWRGRPAIEAIVERHQDRASVASTVPSPWRRA